MSKLREPSQLNMELHRRAGGPRLSVGLAPPAESANVNESLVLVLIIHHEQMFIRAQSGQSFRAYRRGDTAVQKRQAPQVLTRSH